MHEEPLYDQKVTVWCGISTEKVIGHTQKKYFIESKKMICLNDFL